MTGAKNTRIHYERATAVTSMAELDLALGAKPPMGPTPLEIWYRRIRGHELGKLTHGDLARAIRQGQHLPAVVPEAIRRLEGEIWAGDEYPGELIVAIGDVPPDFWTAWPKIASRALPTGEQLQSAEVECAAREVDEILWKEILTTVTVWVSAAKRACAPALDLVAENLGDGKKRNRRYSLEDAVLRIGTAPDCAIQLIAGTSRIARIHALIDRRDGGYVLDTMGHATQVNGKPVNRVELKAGDRIVIGDAVMRVESAERRS